MNQIITAVVTYVDNVTNFYFLFYLAVRFSQIDNFNIITI